MARPIDRCLAGFAALALFAACGGVTDPGLFSPGSGAGSAGRSEPGAGSSAGGASAYGGASAHAGESNVGGSTGIAGSNTEGGADSGGSSAAGAGNSSSGGAAQGGASTGGGAGASSGGVANGGSAGAIGSAGASGEPTCSELFAKASKQLAAAQVCNLAADSLQCTGKVQNPCKCDVPVQRNDSAETKDYQDTLKQLEKKNCVQVCAAIACLPVTHAQCKANSPGSSVGTCVGNYAVRF